MQILLSVNYEVINEEGEAQHLMTNRHRVITHNLI